VIEEHTTTVLMVPLKVRFGNKVEHFTQWSLMRLPSTS